MSDDTLSDGEAKRLDSLAGARSLDDLIKLTGERSTATAYNAAKTEWRHLKDKALEPASTALDRFPGDTVELDGVTIQVHGITHTETPAERDFVRQHVSEWTDDGGFVYCEQGIRSMYFEDFDRVCGMDDYRWALQQCADLDQPSPLESIEELDFLLENLSTVTDELRSALFGLIDSSRDLVGEQASQTVGDLATSFVTDSADRSIARDYASFVLSRRASQDPAELGALQRYYRTAFLPQPVEREWLRQHDQALELTTHARNERMADYVVHHNDSASQVHVIVGAAHQPGVVYYLQQYRDGERPLEKFELLG